ncbi:hypothetical protein jhhlp_003840 [Lomentospora prolificans]|uniref:RING-type E3 ubiquitin transferase n=1 Tax=Lomentospora prolificans TaxID=41688 RepID=A0A2N3N9V3_9PEZI|nr:hypothetical protein jhhlp_003840 [Lomentospora prolificans]
MSSGRGHLDATSGRTVVFCHDCRNEWYGDEEGQDLCPACGNDIIEIVSPENDPRDIYDDDGLTASTPEARRHPEDSDPEEADIEEQMLPGHTTGLSGGLPRVPWLHRHQEVRNEPPTGPQDPRQPPRNPADIHDSEVIFHRFLDMIGGFGAGRSFPGMATQNRETFTTLGGGSLRRTTITSGNGTTSVTITSGSIPFAPRRLGGDDGPAFDQYVASHKPPSVLAHVFRWYLAANDTLSVFRTMLGGSGPRSPLDREGAEGSDTEQGEGADRTPRDPAGELLISLQNLLGLIVDPGNARHGDAVYTQEALDRIISNLMEANPQSNAAPPASEAALAGLERKKMDSDMLAQAGGSVECTVCIDDIKVGEEVVYLPCKHWFHETCVVMWLREHNTCPICRTSIEPNNAGGNRNPPAASPNPASQPAPGLDGRLPGMQPRPEPQFRVQDPSTLPRGRTFGWQAFIDSNSGRRPGGGFSSDPHDHLSRNTSSISADRDQRWPNSGSRRSSVSPPNTSAHGSRTRTRSPSTNSRRSAPPDQDNQRESSSRPFSWIRDHFGRSNR